ncbi:hypothetical protein DL95DRAFT_512608 [Leptodontidium sp. 2 PMI_412]|nr:hypothetical protein DL95DRAFT_512608 [Leptodontidium sp. 2 PMI_412]
MTVFLITNSNEVIILGDSTILARGKWDELKNSPHGIEKIQIGGDDEKEHKRVATCETTMISKKRNRSRVDAATDLTRKTGDFALYGYYIKSVGIANAIYLVSCAAAYSFFLAFTQYWLKWWTESPPGHTWFYMAGYLLIAFIAWSATSARMSAPLSYYSTTDTDTILNRFGQDIQLVDKQLPPALNNIIVLFKLTMQAALLFGVQWPLLVTLPFCAIVVYFLQSIYLVANTTLLSLVTAWTDIEISLGAVSRLRSAIVQTPVEDQAGEDLVPPESWPARGERGGVGKCGATSVLSVAGAIIILVLVIPTPLPLLSTKHQGR